MAITKAQQMMIDDGLPPAAIISQDERAQYWRDHPPKTYNSPYLEEKYAMTEAEIRLLFELKDSKERGAASMGCINHRLEPIAQLEKRGFAQAHSFTSTSFFITDAGVKELKKHKRPENAGVNTAPIVDHPAQGNSSIPRTRLPSASGKGKAFDIAALMRRPNGCTSDEVLQLTGWKAVSMPQQAKLAGVTLVIDKSKKPYRYIAKEK